MYRCCWRALPEEIGIPLGMLLLLSILASGSMAAVLAVLTGLMVAVIAVLVAGRHLASLARTSVPLVIAVALLGGLFYAVTSQYEELQVRFDNIFLGRAGRSSSGRANLWQRGTQVLLEGSVPIVGIGPENFRVVDAGGKQLHNDLLAFTVERGGLGMLGLVLFGATTVGRAATLLRLHSQHPDRVHLVVVVFLAAAVAAIVELLTHQTFHYHVLWLFLAMQEATLLRMTTVQADALPERWPAAPSSRGCRMTRMSAGG